MARSSGKHHRLTCEATEEEVILMAKQKAEPLLTQNMVVGSQKQKCELKYDI
jgi:hypothetical protein